MISQRPGRLSPWILTWVLTIGSPANAAVRAWVDNDRIAPADTVQFTIHRDGQAQGRPDLSPLQQDFDILSTRSSTSVQITNGSTTAGTEIVATLSPKHDGRITIPSISWDGEHSQPMTVTVDPQAGDNSGSSRAATSPKLFVETTVDDKQPYVQAEDPVTVKIYTALTLYHPSLELPAGSDTLVQQVGSDERSQTRRNGRTYEVLTRHYAIFPQRSGHVQLTAPVLEAQVADQSGSTGNDPFSSFFGNSPFGSLLTGTKPIRVRGQTIDLDVKPRPADIAASYWLPAHELQLNSAWRPQPLQVRAGDPASLDLHLQVAGLTAEQLPDLTRLLDIPAGLKQYPDQAKLSNAAKGTDLVGTRDQSIALIADQPGHFTIPTLTLRWWDTQKNQMRSASLPGRTIEVVPAASTAPQVAGAPTHSPAAAPAPQQQHGAKPGQSGPLTAPGPSALGSSTPGSSTPGSAATLTNTWTGGELFWRLFAIASFGLWVLTIAAWLIRRRHTVRKPEAAFGQAAASSANQARSAFRAACRSNDARAARRHLIDWLAAAHPEKRRRGLHALVRETDDDALGTLLRDLDRACYVGNEWSGAALAAALDKLPPGLQSAPGAARQRDLAPLYP